MRVISKKKNVNKKHIETKYAHEVKHIDCVKDKSIEDKKYGEVIYKYN